MRVCDSVVLLAKDSLPPIALTYESYNTGVMNAPANVVFPGHSTLAWSLAVSSFAVGGPFGALVGGRMADSRGRRGALLLDTWLFLVGGILQTFAPDMMTIIVARFIIGFASGFSSVVVPVLLGEFVGWSLLLPMRRCWVRRTIQCLFHAL